MKLPKVFEQVDEITSDSHKIQELIEAGSYKEASLLACKIEMLLRRDVRPYMRGISEKILRN